MEITNLKNMKMSELTKIGKGLNINGVSPCLIQMNC